MLYTRYRFTQVPIKFTALIYVILQRLNGDNAAAVIKYKPGSVVIFGSH